VHRYCTKSRLHEEEFDVFVAELMGAARMLLLLFKEPKEAGHVLRMMEEYIHSRKWTPELEYALKTSFDSMLCSPTREKATVLGALSAILSKRVLSD